MAIQPNIACSLLIKVDTGSSNALESLGYTVDGAAVQERAYNEPIHSDEQGGTAGPPVDIIHHGQVDVITIEMVRFDPAVAAKVRLFKGVTSGQGPAAPCSLLFADSGSHRVLLLGTNYTRNYVRCVVTDISTTRIGSHASVMRITFEAYKNASDVIWNTTTS